MSDYGLRISFDGKDVLTGDDKDMVITSKYANLKGALSGGGTVNIPYADADNVIRVEVTHNLGYIPMARVIVDTYNSGWYYNAPVFDNGMMYELSVVFWTDTTKLYIDFYGLDYDGGDWTMQYKYFIFLDKAKL